MVKTPVGLNLHFTPQDFPGCSRHVRPATPCPIPRVKTTRVRCNAGPTGRYGQRYMHGAAPVQRRCWRAAAPTAPAPIRRDQQVQRLHSHIEDGMKAVIQAQGRFFSLKEGPGWAQPAQAAVTGSGLCSSLGESPCGTTKGGGCPGRKFLKKARMRVRARVCECVRARAIF